MWVGAVPAGVVKIRSVGTAHDSSTRLNSSFDLTKFRTPRWLKGLGWFVCASSFCSNQCCLQACKAAAFVSGWLWGHPTRSFQQSAPWCFHPHGWRAKLKRLLAPRAWEVGPPRREVLTWCTEGICRLFWSWCLESWWDIYWVVLGHVFWGQNPLACCRFTLLSSKLA